MNDLSLSPHFTLKEFEKSATADKYGINNSVPPQYIPTLQQLCCEVLEHLRRTIEILRTKGKAAEPSLER